LFRQGIDVKKKVREKKDNNMATDMHQAYAKNIVTECPDISTSFFFTYWYTLF
jgi:hypothetical protein